MININCPNCTMRQDTVRLPEYFLGAKFKEYVGLGRANFHCQSKEVNEKYSKYLMDNNITWLNSKSQCDLCLIYNWNTSESK